MSQRRRSQVKIKECNPIAKTAKKRWFCLFYKYNYNKYYKKTANKTVNLQTKGIFDFINITKDVRSFMEDSGIVSGLVNIQTMHINAMIILNEDKPLLPEDIKKES